MRKNMYLSMKNLAVYVSDNKNADFDKSFDEWLKKYKPSEEFIPALKKMGRKLSELNPEDVKNVPEARYRKAILRTLTPEIQKEELENGHGK